MYPSRPSRPLHRFHPFHQVGPLIGKMFDMKTILPIEKLRSEIDLLMTEKLKVTNVTDVADVRPT